MKSVKLQYSVFGTGTFPPEICKCMASPNIVYILLMYIYSTTGEHQLHCAAAGVMFPLLISLPHCGYSALLALAALLGLSIAPLPTVTSGVITSLLGPDKLNDAFGELYLCPL